MLTTTVKVFFCLVGFYHLVAGAAVLGPSSWLRLFGSKTYSLIIPNTYEPRYIVCTKFLGSMALAVSAFCFVALFVSDIKTQACFLIIFGVLFNVRAYLRYHLRQEMADAYQLTFDRSLKNIVFNVCLGIATFMLGIAHYDS